MAESSLVVIKSKDIDLKKFSIENLIELRATYPGVDDETLARFLIARENNLQKAIEQYAKVVTWRSLHYPVLKSSCMKEINSGKFYVRGVDKEGRPILIFRVRFSNPSERDIQEAGRMVVWFTEHVIKRLPEDKTKFTVLMDRTSFVRANADLELLKRLAGIFQVFLILFYDKTL